MNLLFVNNKLKFKICWLHWEYEGNVPAAIIEIRTMKSVELLIEVFYAKDALKLWRNLGRLYKIVYSYKFV